MKPTDFPKMPILSEAVQRELAAAAGTGLGELSVRELLSATLSTLGQAERKAYLDGHDDDKGNGSYDRGLRVGSVPVALQVPRSRSGDFRPSFLPELYKRGFVDEDRALLMGLLAASRSVAAAKGAIRKMGLGVAEAELDTVAAEFVELIKLKNTATLPTDLIALYIDGKYVDIRDGDRIVPACIYVAIGLDLQGNRRVLACDVQIGRESLEGWKKFLGGLISRGLRRVLIVVQDDFAGLLKVSTSLFPQADIQLCLVHMQRNAKNHLPKAKVSEFMTRLKQLKTAWDKPSALKQFEDMCAEFHDDAPTFIEYISKKQHHYLHFLDYPHAIRPSFSTTNVVETVNGQLERMRRNNGGYFHSKDTLRFKLGITVDYLEQGRWKKPAALIQADLSQLIAMFHRRFDTDD